jgi:hypothetical protein
MRPRTQQLLVVALALWQVAAAVLSQTGILPGEDVGTISDRYDSAVDPAGYAFSIWGLIYTLSLVLAVHQARAEHRNDRLLARLRAPLMVAFALNGLWIIAFQSERFLLAQAIIVALTAALGLAYAEIARAGRPSSRSERWMVYTPVGTYLGWATIATVAGASTTLLANGVETLGLSPAAWGVVLMVIAAAIVGAVTLGGPPEPGFPLAAAWALLAITVQQGDDRPAVAVAAAVAAVVALAALVRRDHRVNRRHGDAVRAA